MIALLVELAQALLLGGSALWAGYSCGWILADRTEPRAKARPW